MSLETVLENISVSLATIAEKVGTTATPVKKTRTSKKKATDTDTSEEKPAVAISSSTEGNLGADLGDSVVITPIEVIEFTEQNIRDAAAPLVKVSGEGNKDGYNAAQAIILKYGSCLAQIPTEDRGTVIAQLEHAFANWGKDTTGVGGL